MSSPDRTGMRDQSPTTRSSHDHCSVRLVIHARHHGNRPRRDHIFPGDPQKDPDRLEFIYHIGRSGRFSRPSGVRVVAKATRSEPGVHRIRITCSPNPRHRPVYTPSRIAVDPDSPAGQQERGGDKVTPERVRDASSVNRKIPSTTRELARVAPRRHPEPSLGSRLRTRQDQATRISFSTPRKVQGEHYRSQLMRTPLPERCARSSYSATFGAGIGRTDSRSGRAGAVLVAVLVASVGVAQAEGGISWLRPRARRRRSQPQPAAGAPAASFIDPPSVARYRALWEVPAVGLRHRAERPAVRSPGVVSRAWWAGTSAAADVRSAG